MVKEQKSGILNLAFDRFSKKLDTINTVYQKHEEKVDRSKAKKSFRSNFTSSFSSKIFAVKQREKIELITEKDPKNDNLLNQTIIAVRQGDKIYGINDLLQSSDQILKALGTELAGENSMHDKKGKHKDKKLKIGRGFNIMKNGDLLVKVGFGFGAKMGKIGKVTALSELEQDVFSEIEKIKVGNHIDVDIENNPNQAATELDKHNQALKEASEKLETIVKEKNKHHHALGERYKKFFNKFSTYFIAKPELNKTCAVSAEFKHSVSKSELPDLTHKQDESLGAELTRHKNEVEKLINLQQDLVKAEVINFNAILSNISGESALKTLAELRDKVKIDVTSLEEFSLKLSEVKEYGILSHDNIKQIERYIQSKSNQKFNQGIEQIYKLGLDSIEAICRFEMKKGLTKQEIIEQSKSVLTNTKDTLYKINLALNHSDEYLSKNIRNSLEGLQEILLQRSEHICDIYQEQLKNLPYISKNSACLNSETNFLNQVKSYYPRFNVTAFNLAALNDFAAKSGLESDLDNLSDDLRKMISQHYHKGSFSAMTGNVMGHSNIVKIRDSNNFLGKILKHAIVNATPKEKEAIIKATIEGDYKFIQHALIENAKLQKNSREFAELTEFVKTLSNNAVEITTANNPELFKIKNELNQSEYSLTALKSDIIPAFAVNSLKSISLGKSLMALSKHGLTNAIRDFDILLIQILFDEAKVTALTRLEQASIAGARIADITIEAEIQKEFKNFLQDLNQEEKLYLKRINLKEFGLDLNDFTDLKTIEKLCKQGLSSSGELKKALKRCNAVADVLSSNKELKSLITQNILQNDEEFLRQELKSKSLTKLLDLTYVSTDQADSLLASFKNKQSAAGTGKISGLKQKINHDTGFTSKLAKRSNSILGVKLGRNLTNLTSLDSNKSKTHIMVEDKNGMHDLKLKAEGDKMEVILKGLAEGNKQELEIEHRLKTYTEIYQKETGVIPITSLDQENYEKQKKINGSYKGKTSARIINNYFLLKSEIEELANIKENWQDLQTMDADNEILADYKMLPFAEVKKILENKAYDISNIKEQKLNGYYAGAKLVRVDRNGEINAEGKYLAIAANLFRNGARAQQVIGFIDLSKTEEKREILQNINFLTNESQEAIYNNPAFLESLNGFNFDLLHRADDPLTQIMTKEKLDSLQNPENVQKLQKIRNRAYIEDFASELELHNNPSNRLKSQGNRRDVDELILNSKKLRTWSEQAEKIHKYNDELVLRASGNLKEAMLLIRMSILNTYDLANSSSDIPFKEFLSDLGQGKVIINNQLVTPESILAEVGLESHLAPICSYELEKMANFTSKERQEYLYACYADINIAQQTQKEHENIAKINAASDLELKEDALIKRVRNLKPGSKLLIKDSLDVEFSSVVGSFTKKYQEIESFGVGSITPQFTHYRDTAFTLMQQRNGNVALVLNQEQGYNLNLSLSLCFSLINLGASTGCAYDQGLKFEFSGENAAYDAVAFGRKLLEGQKITADDLVKAEAVNLVNGTYYDYSAAMNVTHPSLSDILGLSADVTNSSRDLTNNELGFDSQIAFTCQAVSSQRKTIAKNRDHEEVTSASNHIYYIKEDSGILQNAADILGGPDCDMFYSCETVKNTGSYKGYMTHHTIEHSIALTNDMMSSSNESKYLDHLYNLVLQKNDKYLLYDKKFLQEIEDVIRNNDGEKNIKVTRELKPEIIEVINLKINKFCAGEMSKSQLNSEVNDLANDISNTHIADISISVTKKESKDEEVKDIKSAAKKNLAINQAAHFVDTMEIDIKRFKEINQDPSISAKLHKAHIEDELSKQKAISKTSLKSRGLQ